MKLFLTEKKLFSIKDKEFNSLSRMSQYELLYEYLCTGRYKPWRDEHGGLSFIPIEAFRERMAKIKAECF